VGDTSVTKNGFQSSEGLIMSKFMKWFDGKKTALASAYWLFTMQILPVWFPNGTPEDINKALITLGAVLTYIGLGHKAMKGMK